MARHYAVVGTQWGDEGKGKIVDALSPDFDIVVRYQGGTNAGHTVVAHREGEEKPEVFALHLIPSGILQPDKTCLIADGVVVDPLKLGEELSGLRGRVKATARLLLSTKAHLIMPWHIVRDSITGGAIGTTKRGIGPCYADEKDRRGIRVMDILSPRHFDDRVREECEWNRHLIRASMDHCGLPAGMWDELRVDEKLSVEKVASDYLSAFDKLQEHGLEIVDGARFLSHSAQDAKSILFEGAQATLLDITHGDYPYVTSSNTTVGGIPPGTGFWPRELFAVGVCKAYSTRVGEGPFVAEFGDREEELATVIRDRGNEYGTTTGRPRRCGWLDLLPVRYAAMVNRLEALSLTKLDILSTIHPLKVCVAYRVDGQTVEDYPADSKVVERCEAVYQELSGWQDDISSIRKFSDLPQEARQYLQFVQEGTGVALKYVGVGPEREALIQIP